MFSNKRKSEADESWMNFLSLPEEYVLNPKKPTVEECNEPEVETKSNEDPILFNLFTMSRPVCATSATSHVFNPFAMSHRVCASSAGANQSSDPIASLWKMAEA